jgi:hypothetical protein
MKAIKCLLLELQNAFTPVFLQAKAPLLSLLHDTLRNGLIVIIMIIKHISVILTNPELNSKAHLPNNGLHP